MIENGKKTKGYNNVPNSDNNDIDIENQGGQSRNGSQENCVVDEVDNFDLNSVRVKNKSKLFKFHM